MRGRDKEGGMKVEGTEVKLGLERQELQMSERKTNENKERMRDGSRPEC